MNPAARTPPLDRRDGLAFLILLGGLLAVYSTALFLPYGFADDYYWLDKVVLRHQNIYGDLAVQGRPINALILQWALRQAGGLAGLNGVRVLTVAETAGLGWLLYLAMIRTEWGPGSSLTFAGLACVVPAMEIYDVWATSVPVPVSGIIAVAAAILAGWALDRAPRRWPMLAVAAMLLFVSAITYQPTAMLFWPVAALDLFRRDETEHQKKSGSRLICRGAAYLAVSAVSLFFAWLVFRHGVTKYWHLARYERSGMTHDYKGKLIGFIQHPLVDSLTLFTLWPRPILAALIGAIAIGGLLCYFPGGGLRRLTSLCVAIMLLPLSYLPILLARQMEWDFRTQIGLEWMVLVLFWLALNGYLQLSRKFVCDGAEIKTRWPFLAATATAAGGLAMYHAAAFVAWPQSVEESMLRIQLSRPAAMSARSVILIEPNPGDSPAPFRRFEFGEQSTSLAWVPEQVVNLIRRQMDANSIRLPVTFIPGFHGPWTKPIPPGAVVIDMRCLKEASRLGPP